MPTYEYHCDGCGRDFEVRQRISEASLTVCDVCGGSVHRLISPAPFILKGEGWYVTDYPSAARKKAMDSEKGGSDKPAAPAVKSSDAGTAGDKTPSSGSTSSPPSTSAGSPAD